MIASMTGHGRGVRMEGGRQFAVELSAVNRRGAEVMVNLPREWLTLEARVREAVLARVSRGRVQVVVSASRGEAGGNEILVDVEVARRFRDAALALGRELALEGGLTLESVLRAPGVLREPGSIPLADPGQAWPVLAAALGDALDALTRMRREEGARLAEEFRARLDGLRGTAAEIAALHPAVSSRYRDALRERIAKAGLEIPLDDERLAKEIALFADRIEISEELTRLRGHLAQFEEQLAKAEPVGRTLDFLTQEMARECNTLGVKCNDLAISRAVVAGKAEVEKIREQVQNVE